MPTEDILVGGARGSGPPPAAPVPDSGGLGSLLQGATPFLVGAQVAISLYSSYRARKRASKERKELNTLRDLQIDGKPGHLPQVFGRFGIPARIVDAVNSSAYRASEIQRSGNSPGVSVFRGWLADDYFNRSVSGIDFDAGMTVTDPDLKGWSQWTLAQYSFARGPCSKMHWVRVDEADHDAFAFHYGQRIEVQMEGGNNRLAITNGLPSSHQFDQVASATGAYRLSRPRQYEDIPQLVGFGDWGLVRLVLPTGELTETYHYSNSPVDILAHLLLLVAPEEAIDLPSFWAAKTVAAIHVDSLPGADDLSFPRRGSVWKRPGDWRTGSNLEVPFWRLDFGRASSSTVPFAPHNVTSDSAGSHPQPPTTGRARFTGGGREWEFNWDRVSRSGSTYRLPIGAISETGTGQPIRRVVSQDPRTGRDRYSNLYSGWGIDSVSSCYPAYTSGPGQPGHVRLPLYEWCGEVLRENTRLRDDIEAVVAVMDGARLILSEGKIRLRLTHPRNEEEQEALVVAELSDDDFLSGPTVTLPQRSEVFNSFTATFLDEAADFEESTATWPEEDSEQHQAYLAEDGGVVSKGQAYVRGITTRYGAVAYAETETRQSRSALGITFEIPKTYRNLEPGHKIAARSEAENLPRIIYEVDDVRLANDRIRIQADRYDYRDHAWNVNRAVGEPIGNFAPGLAPPPPITSFSAEPTSEPGEILWKWTLPDERVDKVRLYLSETENFSDAVPVYEALADSWLQTGLRGSAPERTRYGWIVTVRNRAESERRPDSETSSVSATAFAEPREDEYAWLRTADSDELPDPLLPVNPADRQTNGLLPVSPAGTFEGGPVPPVALATASTRALWWTVRKWDDEQGEWGDYSAFQLGYELALGARVHVGTGRPSDDLGDDGDVYVQANGQLWQKTGGRWVDTGIDLTGDPGSRIFFAEIPADVDAPMEPAGDNPGDILISTRENDGRFWSWDGTRWRLQGRLQGPKGADGSDGSSIEHVFAATADREPLADEQRPLDSWPFDAPGQASLGYIDRGGVRWYDGAPPNLDPDTPFLREERRAYRGPEPDAGEHPARVAYDADVPDGSFAAKPWVSQPAIRSVGEEGLDGQPGKPGAGQSYDVSRVASFRNLQGGQSGWSLPSSLTTWKSLQTITTAQPISIGGLDRLDLEYFDNVVREGDLFYVLLNQANWMDFTIRSKTIDRDNGIVSLRLAYFEHRVENLDAPLPVAWQVTVDRSPGGLRHVEFSLWKEADDQPPDDDRPRFVSWRGTTGPFGTSRNLRGWTIGRPTQPKMNVWSLDHGFDTFIPPGAARGFAIADSVWTDQDALLAIPLAKGDSGGWVYSTVEEEPALDDGEEIPADWTNETADSAVWQAPYRFDNETYQFGPVQKVPSFRDIIVVPKATFQDSGFPDGSRAAGVITVVTD